MYWFFILLFFFFIWRLHQNALCIAESLSDYLIKFFFGVISCIIPTGFLLSYFNAINQPLAWGLGVNILAWASYFVFSKLTQQPRLQLSSAIGNSIQSFLVSWHSLSFISKITFIILGLGLGFSTVINLVIVFVTYPNEWDSMTGHLVKCAFYLQNGNMNRLQGTTWTIDYYPNSLPTLQIFFYHVLGEKGFKVIHYLSYWIFALSTYGIAKKINPVNKNKINISALLVFLLTALLPTALIQATTTESDIVLTAYLGVLVYFMFSFKGNPSKLNLALIAWMAGIWIGHKVTFLLIAPAIMVVAVYTVLSNRAFYQKIILFIAVLAVSIAMYVLPNGYIGNIKAAEKFSLGSLSAPAEVMRWHGIEHFTSQEKIKNLELNMIRYTSDFLNFDGIRSTALGRKVNDAFRYVPNKVFGKFHIEGDKFTVVSYFSFNHPIPFYVERPYWGIISFGLLLPIILLLFIRFRKFEKTLVASIILLLASAIHFLSLCYSAPYDPIKSRYFMNMAVWTLPILLNLVILSSPPKGISIYKPVKLIDVYLLFCSIIITISAGLLVLNRTLYPILTEKNIFNQSRVEQLTISRPEITAAYQKFDELVPAEAIVALGTQQEHEDFEYPLWGKDFKRKLIPLHPFRSAVKPIPAEAQYLFYSKGVIPYQAGDISLGEENKTNDTAVEESEFYLRVLKPIR